MPNNTNTSAVEALTGDRSLQAIMASEFKVRGIDEGIPTTALQACIVHVLEALASLQTKAPDTSAVEALARNTYARAHPAFDWNALSDTNRKQWLAMASEFMALASEEN